jgi:hypothetical protein
MALIPGTKLGPYEIVALLGAGGAEIIGSGRVTGHPEVTPKRV